jgi:hypothetical protein
MGFVEKRRASDSGVHRRTFRGLALMVICAVLGRAAARAQTPDEMQKEIQTMKQQIEELQEKTRKQEELIEKLAPPAKPASGSSSQEGAGAQESGQAAGAKDAAAESEGQPADESAEGAENPELTAEEQRIVDEVIRQIQPSLSAANRTFPSQFNPAIGLFIDMAFSWEENGGSDFDFRSAELGLSASVDPFARGYAILNGTENGFEVEEAAVVTTSLPYSLTVKGGRFFADFGRLSKFHDHDLPFVNRPHVLDTFVGGEGQADGAEVSWLAPIEQYLSLTAGAYDKIGADNDRVDGNVPRDLGRFTFLVRPATYFAVTDASGIDLGASYAATPRVDSPTVDGAGTISDEEARHLVGADVTYRYTPLGEAQYRGLVIGTELLLNSEERDVGDPGAPDFRRRNAWGLYSYVELKATRRYNPGFLFDWSQDLGRDEGDTTAYSPYLTVWLSEFQRLRLQYTYLDQPGNHESQVFFQWTAILGSHVHGFRDR